MTEYFKYQISDELIDNPLVPKSDICKYDIDDLFILVENEINEFINASSRYPYINKPVFTTNLEIRYEQFNSNYNSNAYNKNDKAIDTKILVINLYSKICVSLTSLSKDEYLYFLDCLYYKKSENIHIGNSKTTRHLFKPIKASCIIKLARGLNLIDNDN